MEKKLNNKLDAIFWWLIWLLPLIGAFVCLWCGNDNSIADFTTFIQGFSFTFILDIISSMESMLSFSLPAILTAYASYIVSVEIVHVFVDVMVFIPRFAHKLVDLDTYTCERREKW